MVFRLWKLEIIEIISACVPTTTYFSRQLSACDFVKARKFSNRQKNNWKLLFPLILVRIPFIYLFFYLFIYLFNFISDYNRKNMPAVDLKTVSVARSDLTTPPNWENGLTHARDMDFSSRVPCQHTTHKIQTSFKNWATTVNNKINWHLNPQV